MKRTVAIACAVACAVAVAVVLVLALVLAMVAAAARLFDDALSGFWTADKDFIERSGLGDFQLFIAPSSSDRREGYLVVADRDGGMLCNQVVALDGFGWRWWLTAARALQRGGAATSTAHTRVTQDKKDRASVLPDSMLLELSADGRLVLRDGAKVYAALTKDNAVSHAALKTWAEPRGLRPRNSRLAEPAAPTPNP